MGSTPTPATKFQELGKSSRSRRFWKAKIAGANPAFLTIYLWGARYVCMPVKHPAAAKRRSEKRAELRAWIADYKRTLSCGRCGFKHPAALQFHHTDVSTKKFEIGSAVMLQKSLKQVQEEIAKCECICANCHAVHHYEERILLEADRQDEDQWYNEIEDFDVEDLGS